MSGAQRFAVTVMQPPLHSLSMTLGASLGNPVCPLCHTGDEDDHDPERAGERPGEVHQAARGYTGGWLCGGEARTR